MTRHDPRHDAIDAQLIEYRSPTTVPTEPTMTTTHYTTRDSQEVPA